MTEEDYQKLYDKQDDNFVYWVLQWNKPNPMTAAQIENDLNTKRGVFSLNLEQIEASLARLVEDEDAKTDDGLAYRIPGKRR